MDLNHLLSELAKIMIFKGADVNVQDKDGSTPLHKACEANDTELAEILISKDANVNVRDKNGSTPLQIACWYKNIKLAKILVSRDANVNTSNRLHKTPLFYAYANMELADLLISKDANVHHQSYEGGFTVLHYTCMYYGPELVKFYLSKGLNINSNNIFNKYRTPLYCACCYNNIQVVELLLSEGADIHMKDDFGRCPLHIAVRFGYVELTKFLVSKGANVNEFDRNKNTPLTYAYLCYIETSKPSLSDKFKAPLSTCGKYLEITNFLISNGADVNAHNNIEKFKYLDEYDDLYGLSDVILLNPE